MPQSINATNPNNGRTGKMIAVCSAVGGAGRTTVTVNLAAALAERKIKTTILDADLQFGDMALALDVKPTLTIKELVERNEMEFIHDYLSSHQTGIQLLAAPVRPEYADLVTTEKLMSAAESLQTGTDVLLVETPHGLDEQNLSLMEKADHILVVSTPGMAPLKNTKLMVETLEKLGMKEKTSLIVNKSTASSVIKTSDIPELTSMEQAYFLPDEPKHIPHSLDIGSPLVVSNLKVAFSKAIVHIGEQLFPSDSPATGKQATGGFLKKKGKKAKMLNTRGEKNEFISPTAVENPGRS